MRYFGIECAACGQKFTDTDDVVVCPRCGAPHHRACWENENKCAYDEKHSEGFEWHFPEAPASTKESNTSAPQNAGNFVFPNGEGVVQCPACGAVNYSNDMYCLSCGKKLSDEPDKPTSPAEYNAPQANQYGDFRTENNNTNSGNNNYYNRNGYQPPYESEYEQKQRMYENFNRYGGLNPEAMLDGIPVVEYSDYVGGSKPGKIIRRISVMERFRKKVSICWSALFTGPVWFFYRKMKKEGTLIAIAMILCALICGLCQLNAPFVKFAKDTWSAIGDFRDGKITMEDFQQTYEDNMNIYVYSDLTQAETVKNYVAQIFQYITDAGIPLFCCFSAMNFYRKKAKKDINSVRNECSDMATYRETLIKRGGTSPALAVLGVLLFAAALFTMYYLPQIIAVSIL